MNINTNYNSEVGQMLGDRSGNTLFTLLHHGYALRRFGRFISLSVITVTALTFGGSALAEENSLEATNSEAVDLSQESSTPGEPETIEMTPAMEAAAQAHQSCVNAIMSTQAKAQEKRQQIQEQCTEAEVALVEAFPEEIQQLVATDVRRQIESVLLSLEQIEAAVVESAEDSAEIAEELAALEAEQQAQALAEVEALAAQEEQERLQLPPPDGDEEQAAPLGDNNGGDDG
jgi:hypothetical protein